MDYELLADHIASWMRTYVKRAGLSGYVVGLSGGIDSATAAALAVRAVGAERVQVFLLPIHSQPEDAEYALVVADAFDLEPVTVDLSATYDELMDVLPPGTQLARANVKPRLRMTTLYYYAAISDSLVLGTGNRTELMVGYFTKYGDGGADIEPLGDLYKHEVRGLAHALEVPKPVIERPPSAGLWPGQTDEGELGITYDQLDAILMDVEAGREPRADEEQVRRVKGMIAASAHKRAMPPTYPVTRSEG
jgi:NAD+ synthase